MGAKFDVCAGTICLSVGKEIMVINMEESMKRHDDKGVDTSWALYCVDNCVEKMFENNFFEDTLLKVLAFKESKGEVDEIETMELLKASGHSVKPRGSYEALELNKGPLPKPSTEEPPRLELKPLPSLLKHVYLGNGSTLPALFPLIFHLCRKKSCLVCLGSQMKLLDGLLRILRE